MRDPGYSDEGFWDGVDDAYDRVRDLRLEGREKPLSSHAAIVVYGSGDVRNVPRETPNDGTALASIGAALFRPFSPPSVWGMRGVRHGAR